MFKQRNLRLVFLFTLLSMIAGLAIVPYEFALMGTTLGNTHIITILIIVAQTCVEGFIASYIGLTLANKVGLDAHIFRAWLYRLEKPLISKRGIIQAITFGVIVSVIILTINYFVRPFIPQITISTPYMVWWKGLLASFDGGIFEEILCRLFIMSFLVWGLSKLFSKGQVIPQNFVYWIGIIGAALVFGALHLPLANTMFGALTPLLVINTLFLNGRYCRREWENVEYN
ncbi:MAG: putative rane-bound metalloprotease [Bacilli bacterium]|nr:putative rane-bound metalloprotease [Bacilli bacterium]